MTMRSESVTRQATERARLRSWGPIAVVLIGGLALTAPIWLAPYLPYGHDSLFHIFNLFELDRQIGAGTVYPLRFPELGYGYGYAVLSYYPALGYYLLELWHLLGANYVVAYKIGFTLIILGAGVAGYSLGATVFNRAAGVVVGLAYVYNPYFLTDVYTRAALAECLGLVVAPLAFLAIHRAWTAPGWRSFLLTSLALALLVLTHPVSTLLLATFIVAYALLLLIQTVPRERGRVLAVLMAGGLTAGLMTSFYWLPAQLEAGGRRLIDLQGAMTSYASDLKPLGQLIRWGWITALPHDYTLATFSIAIPLMVGMSFIYFWVTRRQQSAVTKVQFAFFAASMLSALWLMSTSALQLWQHFSPILYVQFPFRWFGPLALFTALTIGGSLDTDTSGWFRKLYRIGLVALLAFVIVTSVKNVPVAPSTLPADAGTAMVDSDVNESELRAYEYTQADLGDWVWLNEYVPSTSSLSDYHRFQHAVSLNIPVRSTLPPVQARLVPTSIDANRLEAQVASPVPWVLSFHAFWIPGWSATIDGKPAPTTPVGAIGVVGIDVPAGEHRVRLVFGPTPLRLAAMVVSLLAFIAWLAVAWWRYRRLAAVVSVVLLIMASLLGCQALRAPATPALRPLDVNFGDKIGLQGFAADRTGDTLAVHLVWLAREPMSESYKVFIDVTDDQGKSLAQMDSRPQHYASNTNRWAPGQVVSDRFEVPLPPGTSPGLYQVRVGLYNEANGQRLPVLDAAGKQVDDHVLLSHQEVGSGLAGWRETREKSGRTSTLAFLSRQEPSKLVYSLPTSREYQGGFRILELELYDAIVQDDKRKLAGELAWESGSDDRPLSVSLRLNSSELSAGAQVDQWVLNAQGQAAPLWRGVEQGVTLLDLVTPDLPPGEYELSLIPYFTDTLEPLKPVSIPAEYKLGTVSLP
jgi:hypothetical protein